jgi:hypothetical protein
MTPADPPPPTAAAGKDLRLLVRPGLRLLDACLKEVTAEDIGLILDVPLPAGAVVTVWRRAASLTDARILSARVAYAVPDGRGGWLTYCRFSAPLRERELKGFLA